MPDRKLDIAFWNYDRTRPLADGTIKIEGVDATFHSARIVPEIFKAMIKDRAYDVSELGMTYFLRLFNDDDPPFLALPVFLVRCFRPRLSTSTKRRASADRRTSRANASANWGSMATTAG